jgi:hypothetical protein
MEKHLIKHVTHRTYFDGKSLFEMTVDRNRAIADTILVVGISTIH